MAVRNAAVRPLRPETGRAGPSGNRVPGGLYGIDIVVIVAPGQGTKRGVSPYPPWMYVVLHRRGELQRTRKQDIVFQMNMQVEVALERLQFPEEGPEGIAGVFRS